ncbi:MAG TPA: acyl-CoA desaturase [Acidimicrobiales bacterium]|nr:acyl-CoA desaturase [Acidimicrobiales bacterium]
MSETLLERLAAPGAAVDSPEPKLDGPPAGPLTSARVVTSLLVAGPLVALAIFIPLGWGGTKTLWGLGLAAAFYVFTGFGISVGFHRLFAHRSFCPNRLLKIVLAVAGTMALEGSVISWVTTHRRHHMFSDRPGDPHSPVSYGTDNPTATRGFLWAHVAWLFASDPTSQKRFAPDLLRDPDLVMIDRLFPALAVLSLVIPMAIGWFVTGTLGGVLGVFLWAGLIRMALLHHVTWSINSVCHLWGRRPFTTGDNSANVASLALVSFGESWHNFHHAAPASARHGVLAHQVDLAAGLIRMFERVGWVTKVRWPTATQIETLTTRAEEPTSI